MKSVRVVFQTEKSDLKQGLRIVKQGPYPPTLNGAAKALMNGYFDKYKATPPDFSFSSFAELPSHRSDQRVFRAKISEVCNWDHHLIFQHELKITFREIKT